MPFSEYLGNQRVVTALRGMLANERVPSALLFAGPRGLGKFTLARMFSQAANCETLRDDFCGQCLTCQTIGRLAHPAALVEQGLTERGESADSAMVERVPLVLQTHPDVLAVVPDPVRLKTPVVRPVLHVGQLRAVQRAAYFKPVARRRILIVDGTETMRWDLANIFLKILEEPPDSASLVLLTTNPYLLLSTIRSRCLQFHFAPIEQPLVEEVLRQQTDLPETQIKLAAQLSEGSPGVALAMDVTMEMEARRAALRMLSSAAESRSIANLFSQTTQLTKGTKVPFENTLELLYSLLSDVLELSSGCANPALRNPALRNELASLSKRIDLRWITCAVNGLDELGGRARRNVNRQLGLDAVMLSMSGRLIDDADHAGKIR